MHRTPEHHIHETRTDTRRTTHAERTAKIHYAVAGGATVDSAIHNLLPFPAPHPPFACIPTHMCRETPARCSGWARVGCHRTRAAYMSIPSATSIALRDPAVLEPRSQRCHVFTAQAESVRKGSWSTQSQTDDAYGVLDAAWVPAKYGSVRTIHLPPARQDSANTTHHAAKLRSTLPYRAVCERCGAWAKAGGHDCRSMSNPWPPIRD